MAYNQPMYNYAGSPMNHPPIVAKHEIKNDWSNGLCDTVADCMAVIFCCPYQTFKIRKTLNGRDSLTCCEKCKCLLACPLTYLGLWCFQASCECNNRKALKEKFEFKNDSKDCCKTLFCLPCEICQTRRELRFRQNVGQLSEF